MFIGKILQEDRIVLLEVGNKLQEDMINLKNLGKGMNFVEIFRKFEIPCGDFLE